LGDPAQVAGEAFGLAGVSVRAVRERIASVMTMNVRAASIGVVTGAMVVGLVAGCHGRAATSSTEVASATRPVVAQAGPEGGQATYGSSGEAVSAMVAAVRSRDRVALRRVFGGRIMELETGDVVQDDNDLKTFAARAAEKTVAEPAGANAVRVRVGNDAWPGPIPVVKGPDGRWFFDTAAGIEELRARRVGADELAVIEVCREYVAAQREYAAVDRDGDDVLQYAQHFLSSPGKHDGLYWESTNGGAESPLGPLVARASEEGYTAKKGEGRRPFHGYYFRLLKAQGPHAPGGKYDYVINGNMIGGFALVAWPARYGTSGVMTFVVNHRGRVYEKDLGEGTEEVARAMKAYDPNGTWREVRD
jgi:hypothetical protein